MAESRGGGVAGAISSLEDPRKRRGQRHRLGDVIMIAIAAVICGADGWVEVEEFGKAK